jgi:WhiB family redox-sensing transcriptional regulator
MASATATATNWNTMGNCRTGDPDRLFVTGAAQREARTICRGCPVLTQCLSMALTDKIEYGVWGGMTERDRRALLKARPDITCWSSFLEQVQATQTTTEPTTQPTATPLAPVIPLRPAHHTTTPAARAA